MVSPALLASLSRTSGVPHDRLRDSMEGLTGMFMNELAGRADDHATMNQVSQLISEAPDDVDDVNRLLDAPAHDPMRRRGEKLLDLATGGDPAGLTTRTSRFLGTGSTAASDILVTIAALAMTALRKLGRTRQLDASLLSSLLHSERATYRETMPAVLHGNGRGALPAHRTSRAWWALLLIPLAALMIWSFQAGHRHAANRAASQEPARPASEAMRERQRMGPPPGEEQRQARPVGQRRLSSVPGSAEDQLLEQARAPSAQSRAIPMDRITFARGTATLDPRADAQIANVAKVLQAHQNVSLTITGYPDTAAPAQDNRAVAQARADVVRDALVGDGIDRSRIRTEAQATGTRDPNLRAVTMQITGQP
jgi:outer membrane protein OmpA-like peptidoglycan-associated protein